MRLIEAIIFDLDGLMIDSEPLAQRAWDRVLQDHGKRLNSDTYASMIGLRLEESSVVVRDVYSLDTSPSELADREQVYMSEIMDQGIPTMPGLRRLAAALERRIIPWAVATSSRHAYANQVLRQLDLREMCKAIAAGDEVERGKPAPDVYLLAADRLEVDPASCLALEDSVPGIRSCAAAGMVTVAVPNSETSRMDFQEADFVYDSLVEVTADLDQLLGRNL
jgi:HAD superfamily hydrolase (TIGR01509 family)